MGFTPMEACRASVLVSPISQNSSANIENALSRTKPRGMTPITYSLKQAIKYDFMGFNGKNISYYLLTAEKIATKAHVLLL